MTRKQVLENSHDEIWVEICSIEIPDDWREINRGIVEELKESMAQIGQLNPVIVNEDRKLLAGMHRIVAARELGCTHIRVEVWEGSELEQELITLSENLCRAELCAFDRCISEYRCKEIYETLYPETKRGGKREQGGGSDRQSFASRTAEVRGVTDRTIRREVAVGKVLRELPRDVLKDESFKSLQRFCSLENEDRQRVIRVMEQEKMSVDAAREACGFNMAAEHVDEADGHLDESAKEDAGAGPRKAARPRGKSSTRSPGKRQPAKRSVRPREPETEEAEEWDDAEESEECDFADLFGPADEPEGCDDAEEPEVAEVTDRQVAAEMMREVRNALETLRRAAGALPGGQSGEAARLLDAVEGLFGNDFGRCFDGQSAGDDAERAAVGTVEGDGEVGDEPFDDDADDPAAGWAGGQAGGEGHAEEGGEDDAGGRAGGQADGRADGRAGGQAADGQAAGGRADGGRAGGRAGGGRADGQAAGGQAAGESGSEIEDGQVLAAAQKKRRPPKRQCPGCKTEWHVRQRVCTPGCGHVFYET